MEIQRIQNSQNNLKKNKVRRIIQLDLKTYYKATVVKTVWYQHKEKHEREKQKAQEQTQTYGQLIFHKGAKSTQQKKTNYSTKGARENWILTHTKMKQSPYLIPDIKINSK